MTLNEHEPAPWFRTVGREQRPALTLVCLPHSGGPASMFKSWKTQLALPIEVLAVQYPGHEGRWASPLCREAVEIVEPLAAAFVERVTGPFAVFGHSLGALLAFDLVRTVRQRCGREPLHLFVSGSRAPHTADRRRPVHTKSDAELLAHLRALGGVSDELLEHPDLVAAILLRVRLGTQMYEAYTCVPDAPLQCPLTVLAGEQDSVVDADQLGGWAAHTTGPFELAWLPGGHFFVSTAPERVLSIVSRKVGRHVGEVPAASVEPLPVTWGG